MPTALVESLQRTDEWLSDLGTELYGAREDLRDEQFEYVTTEAFESLAHMQPELTGRINHIERGAEKLDWDSSSQKQSYLDEVQENKQTLKTGLLVALEDKTLEKPQYEAMSDAISELRDCCAGLMEDL